MNAKEYLNQAYRLDQRINSKLEQISDLRGLATKVTNAMSDMPRGESPNLQRMESTIIKIINLENEINGDIDRLVDLKKEIIGVINAVDVAEYQTLLELRYLCFKSWEEIAIQMSYNTKYIFELHGKALKKIRIPEKT